MGRRDARRKRKRKKNTERDADAQRHAGGVLLALEEGKIARANRKPRESPYKEGSLDELAWLIGYDGDKGDDPTIS